MATTAQATQAETAALRPDQVWNPSTESTPIAAHTRINANGRIVIPAAIRDALKLQAGDSIVMEVEDGVLRIETYISRIRRIQREFAHLAPADRYLSDELVAELHQEALLENETPERVRELRRIRDGFASPDTQQNLREALTDQTEAGMVLDQKTEAVELA